MATLGQLLQLQNFKKKKGKKETAELIEPWIRMIKLSEKKKKIKIIEALTTWQNGTELNKDELWAKLAKIKWNNLKLEDKEWKEPRLEQE